MLPLQGRIKTFWCCESQTGRDGGLSFWDRGHSSAVIAWTLFFFICNAEIRILVSCVSDYWAGVWWYANSKSTFVAANHRTGWLQYKGNYSQKIKPYLLSSFYWCAYRGEVYGVMNCLTNFGALSSNSVEMEFVLCSAFWKSSFFICDNSFPGIMLLPNFWN